MTANALNLVTFIYGAVALTTQLSRLLQMWASCQLKWLFNWFTCYQGTAEYLVFVSTLHKQELKHLMTLDPSQSVSVLCNFIKDEVFV